jgi:hypothetical protein
MRFVADHSNTIRVQEVKNRHKSVQSLEAINRKKTKKQSTDVSISIGATTNDNDVTIPLTKSNDGVQEAAQASKKYYADRPGETMTNGRCGSRIWTRHSRKQGGKMRPSTDMFIMRTPLPVTGQSSSPFLLKFKLWM